MMISREMIEEIRQRNDIVELIGSYVNLKRAGSNFSGLCPYHSERSPSFTVFPATQSFYCVGCGAGGDAITFAMRNIRLMRYVILIPHASAIAYNLLVNAPISSAISYGIELVVTIVAIIKYEIQGMKSGRNTQT